jgi:hypothetical protein
MSAKQDRDYKLACFPITEARRIGLISFAECIAQMRSVYVKVYGCDPTGLVAPRAALPSDDAEWRREREDTERTFGCADGADS